MLGYGPEYLLLRRPGGRGGGWQPVTGGCDPGEPEADGAARELEEETGLEGSYGGMVVGGRRKMMGGVYPLGVTYGYRSRERRVEEIAFARGAPEDAPIRISDEHVHGRWFSYQQALARIAWEGQKASIDTLHARLSGIHAGIDPAPVEGPSVALLDSEGRLLAWTTLETDLALRSWLPDTTVSVAYDGPVTLPFGMARCCLEERPKCTCDAARTTSGRAADRELWRQGIVRTFDRRQNEYRKEWMLRSLELADLLRRKGPPLVEVCGLAARRALLDKPGGARPLRGRLETQRALARIVPGLPAPPDAVLAPSELNAVLCAYAGWLHARGRTKLIGDPAEGAIAMPA